MAEVIVTEGHNGGTIAARVGDTVIVKLAETPTTGFRWTLGSVDSQILALTGDEFQPGSGGIGGGGTRMLRFVTKKTGSAGAELRLVRSWEPGAPKNVFRVRVSVS